jgi:hypothetical protein
MTRTLAILALTFLAPGCADETAKVPLESRPAPSSYVDENPSQVEIILERTECYGSCPVYKIAIGGDGLVTYEGIANVPTVGFQEGRMSRQLVGYLLRGFEQAGFFELPVDTAKKVFDVPSLILQLRVGQRTRRIVSRWSPTLASEYLTPSEIETYLVIDSLGSSIDRSICTVQWKQ